MKTAYSESLATFEFSDKCVLVLGQEQSGIPAEIIPLLDKVFPDTYRLSSPSLNLFSNVVC